MENTPLITGMIDSHFHILEMERKGLVPEHVLKDCFDKGMTAAVDIGTSLQGFRHRLDTARQFPGVFHTLGLYPGESENPDYRKDLVILNDLIDEGNIVAIGEIGLDYYWNYATPKAQKGLLGAQLEIAAEHDLPVIIHNREADDDVYDMLRSAGLTHGGVIHCFSSTKETALKFIDLGFFISFAGNVTYKKAENLREAAAAVPLSSMLAETDAPYLAPVPKRGKLSTPECVGYVYRFIAELKGIDLEELVTRMKENAAEVFRLNLPV